MEVGVANGHLPPRATSRPGVTVFGSARTDPMGSVVTAWVLDGECQEDREHFRRNDGGIDGLGVPLLLWIGEQGGERGEEEGRVVCDGGQ